MITSKFKEKMWGGNDLEAKNKVRYYKEIL